MKFGEVGGIIAAASKKDAVPLLQIGSIPIIKRIVLSLQQAGVFPFGKYARLRSLSKNYPNGPVSGIIEETG